MDIIYDEIIIFLFLLYLNFHRVEKGLDLFTSGHPETEEKTMIIVTVMAILIVSIQYR